MGGLLISGFCWGCSPAFFLLGLVLFLGCLCPFLSPLFCVAAAVWRGWPLAFLINCLFKKKEVELRVSAEKRREFQIEEENRVSYKMNQKHQN